jgi:hypothetical protein
MTVTYESAVSYLAGPNNTELLNKDNRVVAVIPNGTSCVFDFGWPPMQNPVEGQTIEAAIRKLNWGANIRKAPHEQLQKLKRSLDEYNAKQGFWREEQ